MIIVYRSFAFFEEKLEFDIIKGQIPNQNYDLMLTFQTEDENGNRKISETIPEEKDYIIDITCNNDATGTWNYEDWAPIIQNLTKTRTKCNVLFRKNSSLVDGKIVYSFNHVASEQEFIVPYDGLYLLELWGASGHVRSDGKILQNSFGRGAYVRGYINLIKDTHLYFYVGTSNWIQFNGSGPGEAFGGGATDVRLVNGNWNNFESLKSRIMVAAGGGGGSFKTNTSVVTRGDGGGLTGINSKIAVTYDNLYNNTNYSGYGASQTAGGGPGTARSTYDPKQASMTGTFGAGGYGKNIKDNTYTSSGGGGGYYGGGHGVHPGSSWSGGGGGSSFISGYPGCNAIAENSTSSKIVHTGQPNHYSGYVFHDTKMISGNLSMPNHDGTGNMTGNTGNGFAKITYILY